MATRRSEAEIRPRPAERGIIKLDSANLAVRGSWGLSFNPLAICECVPLTPFPKMPTHSAGNSSIVTF